MQRQRDRHHRAPGVSKHDGLLHTKLVQGMLVERGMGSGRPQVPWSLAVAVAGSLDDDHPVALDRRSTRPLTVKSWIRVPLPWMSARGSPVPRSM